MRLLQEPDSETAEPLLREALAETRWQRAWVAVQIWVLPLVVLTLGLTVSWMALWPMIWRAKL